MENASADDIFAVAQGLDQGPEAAPALKREPIWGWGESFRMPLYKPGTRVRMGSGWETVSHISLKRDQLRIHLVGHEQTVDPSVLQLEPTVFTTLRVPEAR